MARTKKEMNPRLQVLFVLIDDIYTKNKEGHMSKDFLGRVTNKSFRDIGNRYCRYLEDKGVLIKKKVSKKRGKYSSEKEINFYYLNWNGLVREILKQLIEEEVIEPDEKTIESIKDVLKSKECKEFYKRAKNIGSEKSFYIYLFNPNLLNREDISPKLKKAIKSIKILKEKIRNEYCPESKIPKDYLIEPFLKKKKIR